MLTNRKDLAIQDMRRRNPNVDLVVFWVKLRQRGDTRSTSSLYLFLRKRGRMLPVHIPG